MLTLTKAITLLLLISVSLSQDAAVQTCASNPMIKYLEEVVVPWYNSVDRASDAEALTAIVKDVKDNSPLTATLAHCKGKETNSCCTNEDTIAIKKFLDNEIKNAKKTMKGPNKIKRELDKTINKYSKSCLAKDKKSPDFDFIKGTEKEKNINKTEAEFQIAKKRINRGSMCFICMDPATIKSDYQVSGNDIRTFKIKGDKVNMESVVKNCTDYHVNLVNEMATIKNDMVKQLDESFDSEKKQKGSCKKSADRMKKYIEDEANVGCTDEASCKVLCENRLNFLIEGAADFVEIKEADVTARRLEVTSNSNILITEDGYSLSESDKSDVITTDDGQVVTSADVNKSYYLGLTFFFALIAFIF